MSLNKDNDLERLLNDLVDGTLTVDDERQLTEVLRADEDARRTYRRFMVLHADLLWDYATAAVPPPETREILCERPRTSRARIAWTAVALLLVVLAGSFLVIWRTRGRDDTDRPVIGRVTPVNGEVELVVEGQSQAIGEEAQLRSGTGIHVIGLSGFALLRLDDGTEISLVGETRIECRRHDNQITIALHEGNLSADVAPQSAAHPLQLRTSNAEMSVLGTRLALSADQETSELGVRQGRVQLKRLTDGQSVDVSSGQYAVVSQRSLLEPKPWPKPPETWSEDFENGLPDGWRYGQWLHDETTEASHGSVLAARRFALDGSDSQLFRITSPKQWMGGLWRLEEDTVLHFTYKMSRPGWFQIMMGVRSDDLNPAYVGNYELQSNYWRKGQPDEWRTVSVPLSAFRRNIRGVPYADLPRTSPRAGDVVHLLWFSTGDVDRGLVIDRVWVDHGGQHSEDSP